MPSSERVDADDDVAAVVELALELVRGVGDLALEPAVLDAAHAPSSIEPPPSSSRWAKICLGLPLHLVGERLDEPRAAERVGDVRRRAVSCAITCWVRSAMRAAFSVGQRERLVHRVRVQALRAAEHAGQRLDRGADDVDLGLLRGERHAGGLRVEAQLQRALGSRAVALAHPARPDAAGGAVLGDLLEEVDVRVEEERQARRELVDVEPGRAAPSSTYAKPLASVNASSCAAVEPASRMW